MQGIMGSKEVFAMLGIPDNDRDGVPAVVQAAALGVDQILKNDEKRNNVRRNALIRQAFEMVYFMCTTLLALVEVSP